MEGIQMKNKDYEGTLISELFEDSISKQEDKDSSRRYSFYQGFDKAPAVSSADLTKLTNGTVIRNAGFYIGGPNYMPTDRASDNSAISFTSTVKSYYLSKLLGVAYIYVGRGDQSTVKPSSNPATAYSQGQQDALEAKNFALNLSIPSDSVIYLDIEGGNIHDNVTVEYVKGWVAKINADTNYWAGIYCSAGANLSVASQLYTAVNKKANMWVAKFVSSKRWQLSNCFSK
jgi:hypothetical protein